MRNPFSSIGNARAMRKWRNSGYSGSAPQFIKEAIIGKYSIEGATWVESGTFKGTTTRLLGLISPNVYTIEPAPKLFKRAKRQFKNSHIQVLNGTSEEVLPQLLPQLEGRVCFWLDGHYSGGKTFKGETDSPIVEELAAISSSLRNFDRFSILIDDVHRFLSNADEDADFPSLDYLVDWARSHYCDWLIEQDIFVIRDQD